ncbi:hypothetical protein NQ317_006820 [Molorchus minor]|uniref:PiggyBac transposable element-derived protein domain-containing protein n=1 Tax=Molorchus minor TaxID=1323400 RepID=A0ABQ9IRV7_9CUCU|nr:hypothetical protein NQ317_006820 [Molorchus minor]
MIAQGAIRAEYKVTFLPEFIDNIGPLNPNSKQRGQLTLLEIAQLHFFGHEYKCHATSRQDGLLLNQFSSSLQIKSKNSTYPTDALYSDSNIHDLRQLYYLKIITYHFINKNKLEVIDHLYQTRSKYKTEFKIQRACKTIGQRCYLYLSSRSTMDFPGDFPEIRTSAFYGRKRIEVEAIREIPSDSEDSELSDDDNDVEIQVPNVLYDESHDQSDHGDNPDDISGDDDDTPLTHTQKRPDRPLKTDSKEIEQFLGIIIWMSLIRQHSTRRYWSVNTRTPQIADIMPLNRFEELKRFLHFADNTIAVKNTDKIMPVLNQIKESCQKIAFEEHLSCDEQIIPFKGRTSLKTYNPKKPHKWGYKMYVLSGVSGFSSNFELCSSKGDINLLPGEPNLGAASNIIVRLCRPIPRGINHKVYYDNYFLKLGIKSVATIRSNRLRGLKIMREKEMKRNGRGSYVENTANVDGVDVHAVQWYDNRICLLFLEHAHLPKCNVFFKSENCKKDIDPDIVSVYNMHMGGVDLQDSLLGLYPIKLKSRKWYMRIFCHMIDVVIVNAWLLSRRINAQLKNNDKLSLLQFKTILAQDLCLLGKTKEKKRGRPSTSGSSTPTYSPKPFTLKRRCFEPHPTENIKFDDTGHWPLHTEYRERCKRSNCKGKSRIMCEKCGLHLCLNKENNCFKSFHSKDDAEIIKTSLENWKDVDKPEVLNILDSFECKWGPAAENINKIINDIAHKDLIQKPKFIIDSWQTDLNNIMTEEQLHNIYIKNIFQQLRT